MNINLATEQSMKRRIVSVFCALLVAMISPMAFAAPRVAPEMQIVAAQPAVYSVIVRGNFDLTYPKKITLNKQLLTEHAAALKQAGRLAEAANHCDELWLALLNDPDKYLIRSPEKETRYVRNRVFAGGTAFAVSREGILLSNAHVFGNPNVQELTGLRHDIELQDQYATPFAKMLIDELQTPSEALRERVGLSILNWAGLFMSATGEFSSAELVLKYDSPRSVMDNAGLFKAPQPITVPLEILAIGQPAPGKDVAVLRAVISSGDREKLKAAGARDDELAEILAQNQNDKFICLPLGSTKDILPGAKVQALGFPSSAFAGEWMTQAAEYRVSARDGQIGQTKPVRGGYEMIEMTAGIDHGDSGGPVLNAAGEVIAINVGGGANNATTLAVPIDVAREFLDKAGIAPNPGKLTERWYEGLNAYQSGDLSRASDLLELVRKIQGSDMVQSALPNRLDLQPNEPLGRGGGALLITPNLVNPYVLEMQRRAAARQR
jgi:hypothetical protein